MKRLLLLVPKGNGPGNERKWNTTWHKELEAAVSRNMWKIVTPGVLVLAALTDSSYYKVDVVDEEFQEVDRSKYYDIVAMYTVTPNVKRTYMWAEYYRSRGTYVVLGGVHATMCPDEASIHADTLILGEVEYIWPEFLRDFENGEARREYAQSVGTVDINKSPVPSFELLPPNGRRLIPIQTARGCPHGCHFCNLRSLYGSIYRAKDVKLVEDELKAAKIVNNRATIYFTDDNLFCNEQRAKELLITIKKQSISWYANSDLSIGQNDELLKLAGESGCRQILIGFESINQANLKGLDENNFKSRQFQSYKDVIAKIQAYGIGVVGSFILGLDEDGKDVFDQTVKFIKDTNLYGANITVNTPYPGTRMFDKMLNEGRITTFDWDKYTIFQPIIQPLKMSIEELNEGYIRTIKEVNSAENIIKRIEFFKEQFKRLKG